MNCTQLLKAWLVDRLSLLRVVPNPQSLPDIVRRNAHEIHSIQDWDRVSEVFLSGARKGFLVAMDVEHMLVMKSLTIND